MSDTTIPRPPLYDPAAVQPMRDELTFVGFEELTTPSQVEQAMLAQEGSLLVFINSVCGCAAGSARPGVTAALQHSVIPDRSVTVFAGQDRDAVDLMRSYLPGVAPSSPSIALFKNGSLVHVIQRFEIEGQEPESLASRLTRVFDAHCTRTGPSISPEKYQELEHAIACGSTIPRSML